MKQKHIIHISDLHRFSDRENDQQVVLEAFYRDLESIIDRGTEPCLVMFSGDIVYGADHPEDYRTASEAVMEAVRKLGLLPSDLVLVPGNHDVSQAHVSANLPNLRDFRSRAESRDGANSLFRDPTFEQYARASFANYAAFRDTFQNDFRVFESAFLETYLYPASEVGVVALNTAALSSAGLKDFPDRGNLAVSEHLIRQATRTIPSTYVKIAVGHHPVDWLNDASRVVCDNLFGANFVAYLHGHMHDAQPRMVRGLAGECFHAQAGALFTHRRYYNGYSVISFGETPGLTRVRMRSYFDKRERFSTAEDQSDSGLFYASEEARRYWSTAETGDIRQRWAMETLVQFLDTDCNESLSDHPLDQVFVEPEFEREIGPKSVKVLNIGSDRELLTFAEVQAAATNFIISAPPESGKTSLLRRFAMSVAKQAGSAAMFRIPIYVKASDIPPYKARYKPFLRGRLPELYAGADLNDWLRSGNFVFLIDDVNFKAGTQMDRLKAFLAAYPACRYVITTSSAIISSAAVQPMIGEVVEFEHITLRPLKAGQLRLLIERHGLTDPHDTDRLINKMYEEMSNLSVPMTPVTSTFLIQIYRDGETGKFVNKAKMIERFIEILLEKFASQDLLPGSFDFKNKTHLLSYVSERMVEKGDYCVEESDALAWISSYFTRYQLPYSARDALDYFISARVLKRDGDKIEFKLKVFFEYFCASQMCLSPSFRDEIIGEENYLLFMNEISFYSALGRDDEALLDTIFSRFVSTFNLRDADESGGLDVARLQDLRLPRSEASESELYEIEDQVLNRRLTPAERDALLDTDSESDGPADQTIRRLVLRDSTAHSMAILVLLSNVLKHSELIQGEKKKEVLRALLDGWNEFTLVSLLMVPSMALRKRFWFGGVEYRLNFPDDLDKDEIARRLFLTMPVGVARLAFLNLGTEKLRNQLAEGIGDPDEPLERQLTRFCILADLRLPGIADAAEAAVSMLFRNRYLANVLLVKLHDAIIKLKVPQKESERFRQTAANLVVSLASEKGLEKAKRRGRLINEYKRQEVLLRLKHGVDEEDGKRKEPRV